MTNEIHKTFGIIPEHILSDDRIKASHMRTLMVLFTHSSLNFREVIHDQRMLASQARMDRKTWRKTIKDLELWGYLREGYVKGRTGTGKTWVRSYFMDCLQGIKFVKGKTKGTYKAKKENQHPEQGECNAQDCGNSTPNLGEFNTQDCGNSTPNLGEFNTQLGGIQHPKQSPTESEYIEEEEEKNASLPDLGIGATLKDEDKNQEKNAGRIRIEEANGEDVHTTFPNSNSESIPLENPPATGKSEGDATMPCALHHLPVVASIEATPAPMPSCAFESLREAENAYFAANPHIPIPEVILARRKREDDMEAERVANARAMKRLKDEAQLERWKSDLAYRRASVFSFA